MLLRDFLLGTAAAAIPGSVVAQQNFIHTGYVGVSCLPQSSTNGIVVPSWSSSETYVRLTIYNSATLSYLPVLRILLSFLQMSFIRIVFHPTTHPRTVGCGHTALPNLGRLDMCRRASKHSAT